MKTYIKIITAALLLPIFAMVSSCDIDKIQPENQLTANNAIRDVASAQLVLNGIYDMGREFSVSSFPLYLAAYGNEGRISGQLNGGTGFNTNEVPSDNQFLTNLYNGYYKIINLSNFLIEGLESGKAVGISEMKKNEMISEAKFQRAFAYFNLVRYFGQFYDMNSTYGVVVRTTFATRLEAKPRNTVQEVYDLIYADLDFAAANGPTFIEHFYSGSLAAKALLAKVELYRGNYDEAASLADEVITNFEGYELEPTYAAIFSNSFNSSEVIFAPFSGSNAEGGSNMDQINRTTYSNTFKTLADSQVGTANDGDLAGSGSNYDPRFSFAYSNATKGSNGQGKYPFQSTTSSQNNTMYHLRLGEIYLIQAEAEARRVGGDLDLATERLNDIRLRANVTLKTFSDKPTLLGDIRQEKLLELFYENGEPWFDLVRYHTLGDLDALAVKPTLTNVNQFILPIPTQVIIGNNTVIQNPGY
ncbi:RagB/SusD family nutrient uptake outer membrane protein [Flavobacterium ardleyense]|uniref:RagB/SusD family nutrient uptake outer membrane protein n=1 Tax=Flavobacterium ardleyense TaxID=2038737 RepID=A0ABW5Z4F7_9FLAO